MKKILLGLLLTWGFLAEAQVYNNEWIDYSKTYYKFKVGQTGLHRISDTLLANMGLGNTPAENFQLWRNGVQVPIYTSQATGIFSATDYIEFFGRMNDGKPDRQLYRDPSYLLSDKWSLETDTAAYFLTVNSNSASNLRVSSGANNVAANTLPPDPYFMYTAGKYFNDQINAGYAVNVGDYLYSASYDKAEGWSSKELLSTVNEFGITYGVNRFIFPNLFAYNGPSAPTPKFKMIASGNSNIERRYRVVINSDSVMGNRMDFFNYNIDSVYFPITTLNSSLDSITVTNFSSIACYPQPTGCQTDRMVIHQYEITYPRRFNFGGANYFEFSLAPSSQGNYLQISNFAYSNTLPYLYDISNNIRYMGDTAAGQVRFALPASAQQRSFVLVSEAPANVRYVSSMLTRNFINYTASANQGDYLIITSPALFAGPNGTNPVNDYRLYRGSASGGSYNAKIYLVDELIDQFGFGIKKNPLGIRNFIRYARLNYAAKPLDVFIIGKGVSYNEQRNFESTPDIDKLNLVPTFGYPASDVLLTAEPGSSIPEIPVGRLSAISAAEVAVYLKKVKEYETASATPSPLIADRGWMKNVVHIVGASEPGLDATLTDAMQRYGTAIADTLFGARVETFSKSSSDYVEQLNSSRLQNLFTEGISIITYFGHSSSSTLEFNLDNPENYNNFKKYPIFIGLGCNAGNFFRYNPVRFQTKETLSEKYVLAPDRGTIAFIASTHFGIVHYLDIWATRAYREIGYKSYGKTIGEIMKITVQDVFDQTTQDDFYARCNAEESELHGDPALRLNPHAKPDYVIEDPMVRIDPGFVSVADPSFRVSARIENIGRSPSDSIVIEIKRQFPDQTTTVVLRKKIPGIRYTDSVSVDIPINPTNDKGINKIIVTADADGKVDELYENNNSITKEVIIYEDEARPVYPYNFGIVNHQGIKLIASTANPFSTQKQYKMEMDTTELFNSPLKVTRNVTTTGGTMEFDPGTAFTDSTVYYWRVAPVSSIGEPVWNTASFVYLANNDVGFNQSHLYQHFKSGFQGITLDSASRKWGFGTRIENLFIRQGTWVTSTGQEAGVSVAINGSGTIRNTCSYQSVVFNVFDPVTFDPWVNSTLASIAAAPPVGIGLYGSAANNCFAGRQNNFEYRWDSTSNRNRAMDFMNNTVPNGAYVVVRSFLLDPVGFPGYANLIKYAPEWAGDGTVNGTGQSLYKTMKDAGFSGLDSFNRPRQFIFVYKKNDPSFAPRWAFTDGTYDNITMSADCKIPDTLGRIASPVFGPAKQWKELRWRGSSLDLTPGDNPRVDVIGITAAGVADTLMRGLNLSQQTVDVSSISATQYPYLQLYMRNTDYTNNTPYQLRYWRVTYLPVPEGAIAPNVYLSRKDTLDVAEPLDFKVAFKNISDVPFADSLTVKMIITDRNNVQHVLPPFKQKPLAVGDTVHIHYPADTRQLVGSNYLYVEVNPDNIQPEQYHFNNFAYRPFYVRGDTLNPLLDVTFDNVHILNYDIVSSRPQITIKLKDEAKWFLLDDNSKMKVKVRAIPNSSSDPGITKEYPFDGDTLQFVAASQAPNHDNTATAIFKPYFPKDGKYELIVSGSDMSDNRAGAMEYRVTFEVINKAMISNMLNYPNPFTTSTAFVFTLTGTEVPQNLKIQIMTITGKVVREITKEELGNIHVGRNITDFKWDGTDQYGQKLANGVYLYRVVTNLNGKSLDKYTSKDEDTDKYFNKGYGKMYLMR
jgi:hypothetical protein